MIASKSILNAVFLVPSGESHITVWTPEEGQNIEILQFIPSPSGYSIIRLYWNSELIWSSSHALPIEGNMIAFNQYAGDGEKKFEIVLENKDTDDRFLSASVSFLVTQGD